MLILQSFTIWSAPAATTPVGLLWPVGLLPVNPTQFGGIYLLLGVSAVLVSALVLIRFRKGFVDLNTRGAHDETYRTLLDNSLEMVFVTDADGKLLNANDRALDALGYTRDELPAMALGDLVDLSTEPHARQLLGNIMSEEAEMGAHEVRLMRKDGTPLWVEVTGAPVEHNGGVRVVLGMARDITARKRADQERDRLIGELAESLLQIKTLDGLLPICAHCKKIRDDRGNWNKLENYICAHSDARFSHGICPECAAEIYPRVGVGTVQDRHDC